MALAAERYRLDTGAWPAELADLTPAYMRTVRLDPFVPEQPLKLARTDNRLIIYSAGANLQDDGGNVKRGKEYASGTDTGFILLEPAARNKPASAASETSSTPAEH